MGDPKFLKNRHFVKKVPISLFNEQKNYVWGGAGKLYAGCIVGGPKFLRNGRSVIYLVIRRVVPN